MAQGSPILRFALEVLQHALESYCSNEFRDRKISVLNLAQSLELAIKAALVENNISIFEKAARVALTFMTPLTILPSFGT